MGPLPVNSTINLHEHRDAPDRVLSGAYTFLGIPRRKIKMTTTRFVLLLSLTFFLFTLAGCSNEPTRKLDESKMSTEEKKMRKEKDGD
jgi:hypothetical protein